MARQFTIGRGRAAEVVGSTALAEQLRRAVYKLAPRVIVRIETEALKLENFAQNRWPVGENKAENGKKYTKADRTAGKPIRPHSKALFDYGLRVLPDAVEGFVSNRAAYWFRIKSKKNDLGGKSAVVELLRKPLRKRVPIVAKEIAEDVRALVRAEG